MNKKAFLILLTCATNACTALAAGFTPGNVVVLQTTNTSGGGGGILVEYNQAGPTGFQVPLPFAGNDSGNSIVFGSSSSPLDHDISLSADGALIVVPGYAFAAPGVDGNAAVPRVVSTVKYDGTYARPWSSITVFPGASFRSATSDGFGNFWGNSIGGPYYLNSGVNVVGTGTRCVLTWNGDLFRSVAATVHQFTGLPTSASTPSTFVTSAGGSFAGFSIQPGAVTAGSRAYVANYNDSTNGVIAFTNSGTAWNLAYKILLPTPTTAENRPLRIAVDYSGAHPVLYIVNTAWTKIYLITDMGVGGTVVPTVLATAPAGTAFRGITMAPVQPAVPTVTVHPQNTGMFHGDTVTFGTVAATGANPNAWTWRKGSTTLNNGPTPSGSIIGGATTDTLWITNAQSADLGTYYAVASNNGGSTLSNPALLTNLPTCISVEITSAITAAGGTAQYTVNASACPAPVTYAWVFNSFFPLNDGPGMSGLSTISGAGTASLTISGVQGGDAGIYTVTVTDGLGHESKSSAMLTVAEQPVITVQPVSVNVIAGKTTSFNISATGNALHYQWYKDASPINDGATGSGSIRAGTHADTLWLTNVQPADIGSYRVTVTNVAGTTNSDPVSLTVGVLPVVSALPNLTNVIGSDAVFAATVTAGTPPFTYAWKHNGNDVIDDGHFSGATTATLGISSVTASDHRLYSLSVSNSYGGVTVSALLTVITDTNKPNDVPNLIVYEPFDYPPGPLPAVGYHSWENIISIYNRVTGEPAYWINTGNGLFASVGAWPEADLYQGVARNGGGLPAGTAGGRYPYPGLDCAARNRWGFSSGGCNNHLHFGGVTNGSIYFSFIFTGDQGSAVNSGTYDVVAGFTSGNSTPNGANANTFAYALCAKADEPPGESNPGNVDGDGGWRFGVFKGGGINISAGSVNGQWAPLHCWRGHPYLIVGCYKIVSGGTTTNDDVLSLWVEPPISSFGASEANVPLPDAGGMTTNWNPNAPITEFAIRATLNAAPFSKAISDLRIGKTWASVTAPYFPRLNLANDPSSVTLGWPAKDSFAGYGYKLQTSADLVTWSLDSNPSSLDVSGKTNLVNEVPVAPQFWMLVYPPRTGAYHTY